MAGDRQALNPHQAVSITPHPIQARQNQRDAMAAMLLTALRNHPHGLTAGELSAHFKRRLEVIRPRLTELQQAREIFAVGERRTGRRGPAETVWSTERGQSLLDV